jgi:hypothetical protein
MSRHAKFKFPLGGTRIAFAVVLAILVPAAPHTASGKGGTFHLFTFYKAHSESRIGSAGSGTNFRRLCREAIQGSDHPSMSWPCRYSVIAGT